MYGSAARQQRYTDVRLTSCTRCHASSPVVRMESSSGGEMPALLKATSTLPQVSYASSKSASTMAGSVTSVCTKRPPTWRAAALPARSSMSAQTTLAPSAASLRAAARPIPLPAPVITAVRPTRRRQTGAFVSGLSAIGAPAPRWGDGWVLGRDRGRPVRGSQRTVRPGRALAGERGAWRAEKRD